MESSRTIIKVDNFYKLMIYEYFLYKQSKDAHNGPILNPNCMSYVVNFNFKSINKSDLHVLIDFGLKSYIYYNNQY